MKKLYPMNLQLFADVAGTEPDPATSGTTIVPDGAGNQPGGDGGQQQPEGKFLTQAQIDAIVDRAFARGAAKHEKKGQATAEATDGNDAGEAMRDALEKLAAEQKRNIDMERRFTAIEKNIPADKAEKYVRLAESYLAEDGDFGKALDAALADFPLAPSIAPPLGGVLNGGTAAKTKLPGQAAAERQKAQQLRAQKARETYNK